MLFNSIEFLAFLPIVFILYWFVSSKREWQNSLVVVASYIFYGWWDWRFLLLIAFTSLCSYLSGLLLSRYEGHRRAQQAVSAGNIIINLAILCVFKYYNFFVENLDALLGGLMGFHLDWVTRDIILPVGISFYTFQALSYTIDVYQHRLRPTRGIIEFFAYISFFPQLVAGPIERATNLLPQFQRARRFDESQAIDGLRQMLWGFFKKMVIADNCAVAVNKIWAGYADETGLVLLVGAVLFTFQIYCDFSGYSDIAIGCARLFGIRLMRNFDYPYFSRSIPEFWRRWHISLTTWLRDYIYFPLGGSRCNMRKVIRNLFIVWAVSGLWHGANWTFVCWGLYHGTLLAIYRLAGFNTKHDAVVARGRLLPSVKELWQMCYTFALAVIGWIIFRAESLSDALHYMQGMCNRSMLDFSASMARLGGLDFSKTAMAIGVMLVCEWLQRDKQHALQFSDGGFVGRHAVVRYAIYFVLIMATMTFAGSQSEFIYFQF